MHGWGANDAHAGAHLVEELPVDELAPLKVLVHGVRHVLLLVAIAVHGTSAAAAATAGATTAARAHRVNSPPLVTADSPPVESEAEYLIVARSEAMASHTHHPTLRAPLTAMAVGRARLAALGAWLLGCALLALPAAAVVNVPFGSHLFVYSPAVRGRACVRVCSAHAACAGDSAQPPLADRARQRGQGLLHQLESRVRHGGLSSQPTVRAALA